MGALIVLIAWFTEQSPTTSQEESPQDEEKDEKDEWKNKLQLMLFTCVNCVIRSIDLLRSDEREVVTYVRKRDHFCNIFFLSERRPLKCQLVFSVEGVSDIFTWEFRIHSISHKERRKFGGNYKKCEIFYMNRWND